MAAVSLVENDVTVAVWINGIGATKLNLVDLALEKGLPSGNNRYKMQSMKIRLAGGRASDNFGHR